MVEQKQINQMYNIQDFIWKYKGILRPEIGDNEALELFCGLLLYKYLSDITLNYVRDYLNASINDSKKIQIIYEEYYENDKLLGALVSNIQKSLSFFIEPNLTFTGIAKDVNSFKYVKLLHGFEIIENSNEYYRNVFRSTGLCINKIISIMQNGDMVICDIINGFEILDLFNQGIDLFGGVFEYLISMMSCDSGKESGEFFAPRSIANLMSKLSLVENDDHTDVSIYDGAMGSGNLLLNIMKYLKEPNNVCCFGQSFNNLALYDMARMNLLFQRFPVKNFNLHNTHSLTEDWPRNLNFSDKFDIVLMNPPFSIKWEADEKLLYDPRFSAYGILPPKSKADLAFLLHGFYHLKDTGTMTIILPYGILTRGNSDKKIRKQLLDSGAISAVISLPNNIFQNTKTATVILVLKKNRSQKDVLFIDASRTFQKSKNRNIVTENQIKKILNVYLQRENIDKYAYLASHEEIVENEYNLNIYNYINSLSEVVEVNGTLLQDVASIYTICDCEKQEGTFLTYNDLEYPIKKPYSKQVDYGLAMNYGDIIVRPGGRWYLFYENSNKNYILSKKVQNILVIRPKNICPEVLFLYLETKEITDYLNDKGGRLIISILKRKDLEKLPISKNLPPLLAERYRKLYETINTLFFYRPFYFYPRFSCDFY